MATQSNPEGRNHRRVHPVGAIQGVQVVNRSGEDLGTIEDVAIDTETGRIAYAVLSFGGFLGMGEKLFAVPWQALELTIDNGGTFVLDATEESLEQAPGFDRDHWPDMGDPHWGERIHAHYGRTPYWEQPGKPPPSDPGSPPSS